jgi:mono/diheme cytochrome c family protein
MSMTKRAAVTMMVWLWSLNAGAAPVDFVREVRPIFEKHCAECHGEKKQKSGLRLDVKAAALKGGDHHGPDIVPGNAKESPLMRLLMTDDEGEVMPPEGKISAAEIEVIGRWIDEGAEWPEGVDRVQLEDPREHWAFKPVADVVEGTIDGFVDEKLRENGLEMSVPAASDVWLRRVTMDLTGLPATPEELAAFAKELANEKTAAGARARVVDRLLASPRYGERWAQHWLDVVRYADTHGFEVNTERPNAWPYRDYVIRACNDDVPYDRFIREQIAGDAVGEDAATGFLVTASQLLPGQIGKDEPSIRLARQDSLDEMVTNIGQTFLGLSVGCARCHDHKFDPITAKDYYAMQAFVAGVEYEDRELRVCGVEERKKEAVVAREREAWIRERLARLAPLAVPGRKDGVVRATVRALGNTDRFGPARTKRLRFTVRATNSLEPCIDEIEVFNAAGVNVALASAGAKFTTSGDNVSPDRHEPRFINDGRYGNERSWMSSESGRGWVELEFAGEEEVVRVDWGRDRLGTYEDRLATDYVIEVGEGAGWRVVADASDRRAYVAGMDGGPAFTTDGLGPEEAAEVKRLVVEREGLLGKIREAEAGQLVFAGKFRAPDVIRVLLRGDPEQPKDEVVPAVPVVFGDLKLRVDTAEQERRNALAAWIASPANPLTARVMVNRIWHHVFGRGIVAAVDNFGWLGERPTHPELLDHLAAQFVMEDGWSVKRMVRRLVLSDAFGRASVAADAETEGKDPMNLWWHRMPVRRLEGEAIRDALLTVSGRLDRTVGGVPVPVHLTDFSVGRGRPGVSGPLDGGGRRSIYTSVRRNFLSGMMLAFDYPVPFSAVGRRNVTNVPGQALVMLNDPMVREQADVWVRRMVAAVPEGDDVARVRWLFGWAFSWPPRVADGAAALESLGEMRALAVGGAGEAAWVEFAHGLLGASEFIFLK